MKNKILEPGGKLIYARGDISLRSYDGGFVGLWRKSYEEADEGGRYSVHSLIEVFDGHESSDAIEAAVAAANK
jgi:hypothetical protein